MVQVVRLVSTAAVVGGVLAGSLALGAGLACAAPAPTALVPASCGQTVSALPGDTVRVTPRVGVPQDYVVGGSPGTTAKIPSTVARPMCDVKVRMMAPAMVYAPAPVAAAPMAAAPAAAAPGAVAPGLPAQRIAPAAPVAAAPLAAAPAAPAPRAAAPAKPAARSAQAAAPAATGSMVDAPLPPAALLGAPAPGPAPALAPAAADPASHVVATSNNSALAPGASDGLSVPILIALVAGTGVAAFGVRMFLLRRGGAPGHAAVATDVSEPDDDATVLHTGLAGAHRSA